MIRLLAQFGRWFGGSLAHAFGNPREEQQHLPPAIGVQPYTGETPRHGRYALPLRGPFGGGLGVAIKTAVGEGLGDGLAVHVAVPG